MKVILDILEQYGYESPADLEHGEAIEIPGGAFMPLVIKRVATARFSVAHYYEEDDDVLFDPKITFEFTPEAGTAVDEWTPVQFRQDPFGVINKSLSGLDLDGFAEEWSSNLRKQGFIDRAGETQAESDQRE
jgi:hypothetical protein